MPRQERIADLSSTGLLDRAPLNMALLPEFFALLTPDQLRSVAVAAIVDCAERDGYGFIHALDAALKAWRDHKGPVDHRLRLSNDTRSPANPSGVASDEDLVRIALEAAPTIGDCFKFRRLFESAWHANRARQLLDNHPSFEVFKECTPRMKGPPSLFARRIA